MLSKNHFLPGNLSKEERIKRAIRVNHAGEYGAKRIYEGQMAILKHSNCYPTVRQMYEQELQHLKYFEDCIKQKRVRPTALMPLWHSLGFALGAASSLFGQKGAMACTAAVEEVIDKHYGNQEAELAGDDSAKELIARIQQFREEEVHHKEIGLDAISAAGGYNIGISVLMGAVKVATHCAIWLSKRI